MIILETNANPLIIFWGGELFVWRSSKKERERERVTCGTSWLFRNLTVGRCSEINDPSKVFEGWFYLLLFFMSSIDI